MVKKSCLFIILILIFACTSNVNTKRDLSGKELFRQNCVICHGVQGDLMTNGARNLSLSEMPIDERILVITNGRNIMTGFATKLTAEEIQKVALYSLSLNSHTH